MARGARNNNPLNIRRSTSNWYGLKPASECVDAEFCEFSELIWGVRAALKLLRSYVKLGKCATLRDVIFRWAPPTENNSRVYLNYVIRQTSIPGDRELDIDDMDRLIAIVRSMARFESGMDLDYELCRAAWNAL